jgi:hypothetical protein
MGILRVTDANMVQYRETDITSKYSLRMPRIGIKKNRKKVLMGFLIRLGPPEAVILIGCRCERVRLDHRRSELERQKKVLEMRAVEM